MGFVEDEAEPNTRQRSNRAQNEQEIATKQRRGIGDGRNRNSVGEGRWRRNGWKDENGNNAVRVERKRPQEERREEREDGRFARAFRGEPP